jgi:hypothetical protein
MITWSNFEKYYLGKLFLNLCLYAAGLSLFCLSGSCQKDPKNKYAYTYNAFADICKLKDGRIACVFYNGYSHISLPAENTQGAKGGRIMIAYSADEGSTWTNPQVLIDSPNDDRDPSITQLSSGELLVNYFILNGEGFESYGLWMIRSADNGTSWSEPELISNDYLASSPIRELTNNRLVLGLYSYAEKGVYGASVVSDDNGRSWQKPVPINNIEEMDFDAETDIIELKDGSLYAVLRANDYFRSMHFAVSSDKGNHWSLSQNIGFSGHSPYLYRCRQGIVFLATRHPFTSLRFSTDDCRTWSRFFVVDAAKGAYPSLAELSDGSLLISYYDDLNYSNKSVIKFRKFSFRNNTIMFDPKFLTQLH